MNLSLAIESLDAVQDIDIARSQAAQLEDVFEHIEKLVAKRFKLKFIYDALVKAGCTLTFGSFKVTLGRIRNRLRNGLQRQPAPNVSAAVPAATTTPARPIQPTPPKPAPAAAKLAELAQSQTATDYSHLPWWQQPETDSYGITMGIPFSPTPIDWKNATVEEIDAEEILFWKECERKRIPIGMRVEKQLKHMRKLRGIKTMADTHAEFKREDALKEALKKEQELKQEKPE